ncbi:MAG: molecular chaperone DnaK [Proteobacteria bacterium]|nr:molecular chaperone DnaK [Pseudomonadota bacterium]
MKKIIGIDLGTTNSVVSVVEQGQPKIILNAEGQRTTPSVVAYTKDGKILVGAAARRQAVTNPKNTIFSAKRFIGASYKDIKEEAKTMPYTVKEGKGGGAVFEVAGKDITPPEISAKVLSKLKQAAEDYLGESVSEAVITVPAYFDDDQRQATKDAGKIAGFDVKRIVAEPTAAALAYGLDKKTSEKIAVFDLGGGTFDISILEIGESVVEVLATNGDTHLGGDNFDEIVVKHLLDTCKTDCGVDVSGDPIALQRLKEAAEKAKIELSSAPQTEINLPFITADQTGPKHLVLTISRAEFERMIDDMVGKVLGPCRQVIKDSGVTTSEINEVLLVGGSTRIPLVQKKVQEFFNKEPNRSVNPDEVVSIGAAVQAGILAGDVSGVLLLDVTPLSLGIETLGGVMTKLIERNTTIPTRKSQIFSTAADNQTSTEIVVCQGEREMAKNNNVIGQFSLVDIPPAPRGVPQIEVTFDIDANGIVSVSAKDLGTGKEQKIVIESSSKLSKEDIEKMVKEGEVNADDDKKARQTIEEKNALDSMIYQAEKMLKDNASSVPAEMKKEVEDAINEARSKLSADLEELKAAKAAFEAKIHTLAQHVYAKAGKDGTGPAQGAPAHEKASGDDSTAQGGGEEDVLDAEYEDTPKDESAQ